MNWTLTCLCEDVLLNLKLDSLQEERSIWKYQNEVLLILEKQETWHIVEGGALQVSPQPLHIHGVYAGKLHGKDILLLCEEVESGSCCYTYYQIPPQGIIRIGRKGQDITFTHPQISALHAQLTFIENTWWIEDMHSTNGVYVNRKRVAKKQLSFGDCIYLCGLQIIWMNVFFAINQPAQSVYLNPIRCICYHIPEVQIPPISPQPSMRCQPLQQILPYTLPLIELLDPPIGAKTEKPPLLYTLGPSFTMGMASLSTAMFSFYQAIAEKRPLTSVYPTMIMAFSMMLSTMLWPYVMQHYERNKEREKEAKRKTLYQAYLTETRSCIQTHMEMYRQWLTQFYPTNMQPLLWHKQMEEDVYVVCLGIGNLPISYPFTYKQKTLTIQEDPLWKMQEQFIKETRTLSQVPILANFLQSKMFYVIGKQEDTIAYMKYMIWLLCSLYDPAHIQLVLAYPAHLEGLRPFRYLPHLMQGEQRFLCHTYEQAQRLVMELYTCQKPILICSFDEQITLLFQNSTFQYHHVLFAFHDSHDEQEDVIHIEAKQGTWKHKEEVLSFTWNAIDRTCLSCLASKSNHAHQQQDFPTMVKFLQMFQVAKVEHLHIWKRWMEADSARSLSAPLGIQANGECIYLDVHEKAHGPHGIIAGMTGSGKSEFLITLILSLALCYHPHDVAFILIDYKGGGMAKVFADLPHTAGIITNLDGSMIARSLNSLDSELIRRQKLFAQVSASLGQGSMDIYTYQRLFHEHKVSEAIPHLVIIADEFAELKQQQPQFMEQLIRSARIGRSLGIHLLLATQKPSGVVDDQIWSNSRFHICLKVAEKADSMDMLKREDGALLTKKGRFFLQVGYNEIFAEGQASYSKALYDGGQAAQEDAWIQQIDERGEVIETWKKTYSQKQQIQELQVVLEKIKETAVVHKVSAPTLWLPPLAKVIEVDAKFPCMVAMLDDPRQQNQRPLCISKEDSTHMLLIAADLTETHTLFHTLLWQWMKTYESHELCIMIFDFDQGTLADVQPYPHIFGVLGEEEREDGSYLFHWMKKLYDKRKREKSNMIFVCIIHHIASFLEQYGEEADFLYKLCRDGARYGIYLWISAATTHDLPYKFIQQFPTKIYFHNMDEELHPTIPLPPYKGRAIFKQEEEFEIQVAHLQVDEAVKKFVQQKPRAWSSMVHLPSSLHLQDITDFAFANRENIPIGMDYETHEIVTIQVSAYWVFTGPRGRNVWQLLEQYCKEHHLAVSMGDVVAQPSSENMQERIHILYVPASQLFAQLHDPWYSTLKEEGHIFWVGKGLDEFRYQLDIMHTIEKGRGQDGFRLDETLQRIRFLEAAL